MDLSKVRTDKALESDGVWVPIRYGAEVKVARLGNPRGEAWRARLSAEDRRLLDNRTTLRGMEQRIADLTRDMLAETVLLDWRNIYDGGEPIPFSVETAKLILSDPELEFFVEDVLTASRKRENFFQEEVREAGNSSRKSSAGKGATPKS